MTKGVIGLLLGVLLSDAIKVGAQIVSFTFGVVAGYFLAGLL